MVSEVVLRSQRQAVYAVDNVGHFGLNLPRYAHFTSPIRRYADLVVHRALVKACKLGAGGQPEAEGIALPDIADQISDLERRAMAAEREATDRYLAGYLQHRERAMFDARVRGVTKFGLFVMLDESGADGFIPMRNLGFERFRFEEARHSLIGETTGGIYRLGQSVQVRLIEATPIRGGLLFEMESEPLPAERKPKKKQTRKTANSRKPAKKTTRKKTRKRGKANAKPRRM